MLLKPQLSVSALWVFAVPGHSCPRISVTFLSQPKASWLCHCTFEGLVTEEFKSRTPSGK